MDGGEVRGPLSSVPDVLRTRTAPKNGPRLSYLSIIKP